MEINSMPNGIQDIQNAVAEKQNELLNLTTLENCTAFEQGIDLARGLPDSATLLQLIANKEKQIEALSNLIGAEALPIHLGSEEKLADYGTDMARTLLAPIGQFSVVLKDPFDPDHKELWKEYVTKAWSTIRSLRYDAPPAAGSAINYDAAFQNMGYRLQNPPGANPQEMNALRLFLKDFPAVFKTDKGLEEFGRKTFAQRTPSKFEKATEALTEFANIVDISGKTDRWVGPSYPKFVATLEGYVRKFKNAYNSL